jgi:hypothetical protein
MSEINSSSVNSLDYVRMHCTVVSWIEGAADEDERERLTDLAQLYFRWATAAAEHERHRCLAGLATDLRAYLDADGRCPDRACGAAELEQVRAVSAVTPVGRLHDLRSYEMLDFADLIEGWAQTPDLHPIRSARLFGAADGLRDLADAAGANWSPDPDRAPSLAAALARAMR